MFTVITAASGLAAVGGRREHTLTPTQDAVMRHTLTPTQDAVMRRISGSAEQASRLATAEVLTVLDDPELRTMLKAALPVGATTIDPAAPAAELLARFRAEVAAAEGVHSFRATPQQTQVSMQA